MIVPEDGANEDIWNKNDQLRQSIAFFANFDAIRSKKNEWNQLTGRRRFHDEPVDVDEVLAAVEEEGDDCAVAPGLSAGELCFASDYSGDLWS